MHIFPNSINCLLGWYNSAMSDLLNDQYKYFEKNRDILVKKYPNKHIIIKDSEVKGAYNTEKEAYDVAISQYSLGTFLIQQCLSEKKEDVAVFHTRAIFN
ncbi:MAG: hypothetical protein UW16_C0021G0005 [Microgenomates group bacterium GW2011_GWC1_44_10]|uniref:DUF5678 domain-containing protein n=2 Tax=Microgenomates group TaxID=1794810 RepID=A0A0G1LCW8_9BACT|nr:MAG: hypothetical protein UW16_C0021G0005 [Microgenomates group bacterium GW2011_GWC1_44_10]KKT66537.1 MAG: hypothetical protein UW60_C0022G0010 [Candidatus Woesebacteria bacterium GW2011_GWA2_44_33]